MTIKSEVKEIWDIIGRITDAMESFDEKLNTILAYHTLRAEIADIVAHEVKQQLDSLGIKKNKEFTNHSKSVV